MDAVMAPAPEPSVPVADSQPSNPDEQTEVPNMVTANVGSHDQSDVVVVPREETIAVESHVRSGSSSSSRPNTVDGETATSASPESSEPSSYGPVRRRVPSKAGSI